MLIPFTYALSLLAPLVESIGKAIGSVLESIGKGIASIVTSIGDLLVKVLPLLNLEAAVGILAMAAAFTVLAGSLALLSTLGLAAIPVLLAVGAVGAVGASLFGGGGEEGAEGGASGDRTGELIDEIKGLRADLIAGKIAVNIDGQKVTANVGKVVSRVSANSYAKV
jgi:phage tail tape-measure protein